MTVVPPKYGKLEELHMENPILGSEYVPTYAQKNTDMSVGDWVATLILTAIPLVGFICLIVWAVSSSPEKRSRKNWAIAQFIITLVILVLTVVLIAVYGASIAALMRY